MRSHNSWKVRQLGALLLRGALLLPLAGCASPWWNGWLSPIELGNFRENRVNEIQRSISLRDKPLGVPGASDPTPEDLIAQVEEYRIGPGDTLSIRLLDFLQLGMESEIQPVVDELGYIDVPQLGWLQVEGMTPRQLQAEIVRLAKAAGIYPADSTPTVLVNTLGRQQRTYNISGAITAPGPYPIVRPDFRLREAINQAGGLSDVVRYIYVFRNEPRQKRVQQPSAPHQTGPTESTPQGIPPVIPSMAELWSGTGATAAATQGKETYTLPADETEQDLREALAPAFAVPAGSTAPGAEPAPRSPQPGPPPATQAVSGPQLPTYIMVDGQFVEAPAATMPGATPPPADASRAPAAPSPPSPTTEAVDWEELAAEGQQRVIRIPAEKLKNGDPSVNIVIRHQDWVQLDAGEFGVFYVMGHVLRPGPYQLTGNDMTLTRAIAAAGGLDQLAWPTRCEIRRRLDGEREEITQWDLSRIMAGQDPDLFIKKDDVVNVGTHAVAPLLATIRNSFRLTYGFGFVYDRNFADIDAVFSQANPRDLRRSQRAFRGLLP